MRFIDSHCHLSFPELTADITGIQTRMADAAVSHALVVCTRLDGFNAVRDLAQSHENLFGSVGVHPDEKDAAEPSFDDLMRLQAQDKIIAIGETGLDYFRVEQGDDMAWQRERFRIHIAASIACGKPLIIHTRAAAEDTIKLMQENNATDAGGVIHCFTESWEFARSALDMGFYISFSGIVTFKNAQDIRDVAIKVPADRILIETDAPYLAPVPYRGRQNEPAYVPHVAKLLADIRGESLEFMAETTANNFMRLFKTGNL